MAQLEAQARRRSDIESAQCLLARAQEAVRADPGTLGVGRLNAAHGIGECVGESEDS